MASLYDLARMLEGGDDLTVKPDELPAFLEQFERKRTDVWFRFLPLGQGTVRIVVRKGRDDGRCH